MKKVSKMQEGQLEVYTKADKEGVLGKFHNRSIEISKLSDNGVVALEFKSKTKEAEKPSIFHRVSKKGKVKVSTIILSDEAIQALYHTLGIYLEDANMEALGKREDLTKKRVSDNPLLDALGKSFGVDFDIDKKVKDCNNPNNGQIKL